MPVDRCEFWGHLGKPPRRHLYRDVLQAGPYDYVIDSSKHHAWLIDGLRACDRDGLRARLLVSWRPPIHVTHSVWKRGLTEVPTGALLANVHHLNSLGIPYLPVRYDELVADAPGTISAVYDYVGGVYRDGQERFWEGSFHSFFGAEFTRNQLGRQSEFVSPVLPDEFLEFWDRVPAEDKRAMQRLDDEMHAPHTAHRRVRRRPWYWKSRVLAVRNSAAARRRVRSPSPA